MTDLHDFPPSEYQHRQNRARVLMESAEIGALITTDSANVRLLSGARPGTKNRPTIFCLPKSGDPTLIVNSINESYTRRYSWVKDIITYGLPFNLALLKQMLKDRGLMESRIGVELEVSWFPSSIALKLQKEMPKINFVDATDILRKLRIIKTDAEIHYLKKACEITGNAYKKFFETIKEGMSEKEVAITLFRCLMEEGADLPLSSFLLIHSGGEYIGSPTDKPLRRGDLLWFDSGCSYKGYHSDFGRSGVVGPPSSVQKKTWEQLWIIANRCCEAIKPGILLNEIHKEGVKACKELGLNPKDVSGALASRRPHIGHSIGLEAVEPPMIDPWNQMIIEPNMVFTIEPAFFRSDGVYHLEPMLIVTKDGYEIISDIGTKTSDLLEIASK